MSGRKSTGGGDQVSSKVAPVKFLEGGNGSYENYTNRCLGDTWYWISGRPISTVQYSITRKF